MASLTFQKPLSQCDGLIYAIFGFFKENFISLMRRQSGLLDVHQFTFHDLLKKLNEAPRVLVSNEVPWHKDSPKFGNLDHCAMCNNFFINLLFKMYQHLKEILFTDLWEYRSFNYAKYLWTITLWLEAKAIFKM